MRKKYIWVIGCVIVVIIMSVVLCSREPQSHNVWDKETKTLNERGGRVMHFTIYPQQWKK